MIGAGCFAVLAGTLLVAQPAPMTIDADFSDWIGVDAIADPSNDAVGPFDLSFAEFRTEGTRLYASFDAGRVLNLQNGPSTDAPLCLDVRLWDARWVTIDLRNRKIDVPGKRKSVPWRDVGLLIAPTYASDRFEVSVDLWPLGVREGDSVLVGFSGSDSLDIGPVEVRFDQPTPRPANVGPVDRPSGTDLRIANLNTNHEGLLDPKETEGIARLLRAINADVFTFQEEWKSPADAIARRLNEINPGDTGAPWNVHKVDGCIIASRRELEPVINHNDRYAAAIIDPNGSSPILVLAIHPKCCGYIGSKEDRQRIEQTAEIIQTIAETRRDYHTRYPDRTELPVIVQGDWNLVGSDTPLQMLTDPNASALARFPLRHLDGRQVYTYYDEKSPFPPGLLDLVTYSPRGLKPLQGFVLDTQGLPAVELKRLGLRRNDSRSTDHLMLVADFTLSTTTAAR